MKGALVKRIIRSLPILLLVMFALPAPARADVAPPGQPGGSNPEPGVEFTQVRMVAEAVVLEVLANTPQNSLAQARVNADFTMRNLGDTAESMGVRFPLSANNGFGKFPEIKDVSVKVDGVTVSTRRIMQEDPVWGDEPVPWAEFDVIFPPGQDVNIQVTYLLEGEGEYPYVSFDYVFHTGAGWRDTIGSADLIVRFPYEANSYNVLFDVHTGWSYTTPGGVFDGREVRWHFDELEPERENDFQISVVMPSVWQQTLKEQAIVQANPNDGEAWGRLGKLYKEMYFFRRGYRYDAGGSELFQLSIAAYEKSLALLPDDALWHAGFAELLAVHSYYASQDGLDTRAEMVRSMQEIQRALELSPNDPKVQQIAESIYYFFPDGVQKLESGYDYLWLTATPGLPTPEPTFTEPSAAPSAATPPPAAETTVPVEEATSTPIPAPESPTAPLCGSAFLLPLGLVWLARRKTIRYR